MHLTTLIPAHYESVPIVLDIQSRININGANPHISQELKSSKIKYPKSNFSKQHIIISYYNTLKGILKALIENKCFLMFHVLTFYGIEWRLWKIFLGKGENQGTCSASVHFLGL